MRSRIKEHRRQQVIKSKLGDKYKPHSPRVTIKQDALKLNPYLASADSIPLDLPDIDLNSASSTQHKTTLGIKLTALLNNLQLTSSNESISQTSSKSIKKSTSNYQPNEAIEIRKDVELDVSQYNIETHSNSIPLSTHQKGPYFAYNIIPDDSNFIFFKTPKLLEKKDVNLQAELTNRIVSLKNSNAKERLNFNKQRIIGIFGENVGDCGNSSVQVGLLTLKINQMKQHLANNKKDIGTKRALFGVESKRIKMLKYLRRSDIEKFVVTCRALGIDPEVVCV